MAKLTYILVRFKAKWLQAGDVVVLRDDEKGRTILPVKSIRKTSEAVKADLEVCFEPNGRTYFHPDQTIGAQLYSDRQLPELKLNADGYHLYFTHNTTQHVINVFRANGQDYFHFEGKEYRLFKDGQKLRAAVTQEFGAHNTGIIVSTRPLNHFSANHWEYPSLEPLEPISPIVATCKMLLMMKAVQMS